MEIRYLLQEEDIRELIHHQIRQSPLIPRRIRTRRNLYVVAFGLLALGAFLLQDRLLPYAFASLAVLCFLVYAPIARRRLISRVPSLVQARITETSLGERRLRALASGLESIAANTHFKLGWPLVGSVETSETHIFIPIDGAYTIVIPISRVTSGDLANFVASIAKLKKAAA